MAATRDLICLGVIAGAHGVRGELRLESYTRDPAAIAGYGPLTDAAGERRFVVKPVRVARGGLVARLDGIADRDAAEALRGTRLFVERERLPAPAAEEFYHADLIGLAAELADGSHFGRVRALHDFGAGDVIEIARPDGELVMLPFSKAAVPSIEIAAGRLTVAPPAEIEAAAAEGEDRAERRRAS